MSKYASKFKIKSANQKIGYTHRPNTSEILMNVEVLTNSDGLRDRDYPVKKNKKIRRFIFLGDSLTFGWGVKKSKTFEELLEKRFNSLSPTEILNFAHGNYNTEQQVNHFSQIGTKYKPDEVVVFFFINDTEVTPRHSEWEFILKSRLITLLWSSVRLLKSKFSDHKYPYYKYYSKLYEDGQPGMIHFKNAVEKIKELSEKQAFKLRFVLLPELHNLMQYPFQKEHEVVSSILNSYGIKHMDLIRKLKEIPDSSKFWVAKDDAHPNADFHKIIAESTFEYLSQDSPE